MPLNTPGLYAMIYAAFQKQAVKGDVDKSGVPHQLASDLTRAIDAYVRSGTVQTAVTSFGVGASAPHPFIIPVFTVATGTGIGLVL
tara:strand:- start:1524 stop:1781 length:258 start_codon:yes stop_codon:yes gene_type:complete